MRLPNQGACLPVACTGLNPVACSRGLHRLPDQGTCLPVVCTGLMQWVAKSRGLVVPKGTVYVIAVFRGLLYKRKGAGGVAVGMACKVKVNNLINK